MNVSDALADIRFKIHDTDTIEMTDTELLTCLNEAIQYVGSYLCGANSPISVIDLVMNTETITLPSNFVKTVGIYPLRITGNTIQWLDYTAGDSIKIRYFATPAKVTAESTMPFQHDALNQITIKLAAIYAGNQLEAEISQDKALLDEINTLLAQAVNNPVGGVVGAGGGET